MVISANKINFFLAVLLLVFIGAVLIFSPSTPTGFTVASVQSFKINSVRLFLDSAEVTWTPYPGKNLHHYEVFYKESTSQVWNRAAYASIRTNKVLSSTSGCTGNQCTVVIIMSTTAANSGPTRVTIISGLPDVAHTTYMYRVAAVNATGRVLAYTAPNTVNPSTTARTLNMPYCNDECMKTYIV